MIQLANDPNASRSFNRADSNLQGQDGADAARARSGHAWPFLSPCATRPLRKENTDKPAANDSGS